MDHVIALAVDCPVCHATRNQWCTTPDVHQSRIDLALAVPF